MDTNTFIDVDNYRSATNQTTRPYVEEQIKEELANGRYVITHSKPNIVSALGAIPKDNSNTKFRIIHDASRPRGQALNDLADLDPFTYQSLQDAVDIIKPGSYLAKVDLQSSFRSVGLSRDNYAATGLKWRFKGHKKDTYMVDTRMCFGGRRAPGIFNMLTQAVRDIMVAKGIRGIIVYTDDFLLISDSFEECRQMQLALISLLRKLGFAISYGKVEGPKQCIVFLGFELNTTEMTIAVPTHKVQEILDKLLETTTKEKITKRALQSLIGRLSWATQVIYGGRFHLRRLLDRVKGLTLPTHRTRITTEMRKDMAWWINFMSTFNGLTRMVDPRPAAPLTIDACGVAAGAYYLDAALYTPWYMWPPAARLHINHKEVLALEPAAATWAPLWANKRIFVHCDNMCAVHTINKGISRNPIVMDSLRRVFWLSALYNFRLKAVYYPGVYNTIADSISRLHEPNARASLSQALNTAIPYAFIPPVHAY